MSAVTESNGAVSAIVGLQSFSAANLPVPAASYEFDSR